MASGRNPADNWLVRQAGLWSWDVKRDVVYADPTTSDMLELTAEEGASGQPMKRVLCSVHPDDRPLLERGIRSAIEGVPTPTVYRTRSRLRGERRLLSRGRCFYDSKGKPICYPGYVVDITDAVQSDLAVISAYIEDCRTVADRLGSNTVSYLVEALHLELERLRGRPGTPFH